VRGSKVRIIFFIELKTIWIKIFVFHQVEIWHIGMASTVTTGPVSSNFKLTNPNDSVIIESIKSTVIKIDLREDFDIISVSFSADGSNISLALSNGSIYFYQVCNFTCSTLIMFIKLKLCKTNFNQTMLYFRFNLNITWNLQNVCLLGNPKKY